MQDAQTQMNKIMPYVAHFSHFIFISNSNVDVWTYQPFKERLFESSEGESLLALSLGYYELEGIARKRIKTESFGSEL